ncbi:MAG: hypothetical protein ACR2LX_07705 [Jatrophihabitans sp.]
MTTVATSVCLVLALAAALVAGVRAFLDRVPTRADLLAAALVELAVLFYVGVRVAGLIGGHHTWSLGLVIAYLVGITLVMPVTAALGWAEPSRWGSVVLAVGALVVCVLLARVAQLWTPHG